MTFRDDREALLHRTDALEREAERLRRENEELRERAGERDELRALAASAPASAPAPAVAKKPETVATPQDPVQALQDESLATPWTPRIGTSLPFVITFGGIGGSVLVFTLIGDSMLLGMLPFLVLFPGVFGLWRLSGRLESRRERRWVMNPPIPLDGERYLHVLGHASRRKVVVVRLVPREAPSSADRELAAAAARAGRGVAGAAWEDGALVIRSESIETATSYRGKTTHSNHQVHRWFRTLVTQVLVPITKVVPASTITVTSST